MNIVGIICEYNPFHNGHLHQINEIRKQGGTHIVAVMSGNYVQRGDVASFSKWTRAKVCIENGIDLVVELPTPLAMSPAKDFALGAISILDRLGIDTLSFGSESSDKQALLKASKLSVMAEDSDYMKEFLQQGLSYPRARQKSLEKICEKSTSIMLSPNDLLGMEYINAISQINPSIDIMPIKRENVLHDSTDVHGNIASASMIRKLINEKGIDSIKDFVPESAFDIYMKDVQENKAPCTLKNLEKAILYKIKTTNKDSINNVRDVVEGLGNRIWEMGQIATSLENLFELCATKRYTNARIRRVVMNIFLDIHKDEFNKKGEYVRVLAMNEKGKEILKLAKKNADGIMVSPKFANIHSQGFSQAEFENKATNIYALASNNIQPANLEFTQNAIIK